MIPNICVKLSERFKNTPWVESVSLRKENFIPDLQTYPWDRVTLSHGLPGLIILFAEMDHFYPTQGWDLAAHQCVVELAQAIESNGVRNASLFSGLAGICCSVQLASKNGTRYGNLLSQLFRLLVKQVEIDYLLPMEATRKAKQHLSPFQYDVIIGISGILPILLANLHMIDVRPKAVELVKALVSLKEPVYCKGFKLPGWYIPQHYVIQEQQAHFDDGCFDTGMAHGIAGCLAALSKAHLAGLIVDSQREAMQVMCAWLLHLRINSESMIDKYTWPSKFAFNPAKTTEMEDDAFYRDGWCYGAPGIACSLYLASKALKDENLKQDAIATIIAACERFLRQSNLECVSFCHGLAGFLAIVQSFHQENPSHIFSQAITKIVNLLIECYDCNLPFGYKCHASLPSVHDKLLIDNVGFLDGTVGTLLSLLYSCSQKPRNWLSLLLVT